MDGRVAVIYECALKGRTRLDSGRIIDATEKWLHSEQENLVIEGIDKENRLGGAG